jgi:Mn-containing catalase
MHNILKVTQIINNQLMFHHVKDLQFNARVSKPDVRFAKLLLEQFGGPNGELRACSGILF